MRRKLLLFGLPAVLLVSTAFDGAAKPLQWQDATVLGGPRLYTSTVRTVQVLYWINTDKITYVIPNYSNGWLVLPVGRHTRIAVDGSKIHVLDVEGKDRLVRVVWKIPTKP